MEVIPQELFDSICVQLSPKEVCALASLNRAIGKRSESDSIWGHFCARYNFPLSYNNIKGSIKNEVFRRRWSGLYGNWHNTSTQAEPEISSAFQIKKTVLRTRPYVPPLGEDEEPRIIFENQNQFLSACGSKNGKWWACYYQSENPTEDWVEVLHPPHEGQLESREVRLEFVSGVEWAYMRMPKNVAFMSAGNRYLALFNWYQDLGLDLILFDAETGKSRAKLTDLGPRFEELMRNDGRRLGPSFITSMDVVDDVPEEEMRISFTTTAGIGFVWHFGRPLGVDNIEELKIVGEGPPVPIGAVSDKSFLMFLPTTPYAASNLVKPGEVIEMAVADRRLLTAADPEVVWNSLICLAIAPPKDYWWMPDWMSLDEAGKRLSMLVDHTLHVYYLGLPGKVAQKGDDETKFIIARPFARIPVPTSTAWCAISGSQLYVTTPEAVELWDFSSAQ